jgi:hypothetical protein
MSNEATRIGADFSVAFLPGARSIYFVDVDFLKRSMPNVNVIDLDSVATTSGFYPAQTIAHGHYNSKLAAVLGSKIGREICSLVKTGAVQKAGQ